LARYNEKTRKLNYINAGHNPTILYCNGEAIPLRLGTTMIGAFDELPFLNEGEIDIEPNSLFFNYTDGLMDHELQNYKNWSEEKLLDFVIANGSLSPDDFNEAIMNHINTVVKGKPIDDITLLNVEDIVGDSSFSRRVDLFRPHGRYSACTAVSKLTTFMMGC
jgi:sigma-B regulation protein RsbU (phosphoserine phosphatase)